MDIIETRRNVTRLAAASLLCGALPALATTVVPMRDATLVDRTRVIVVGHVEGRLPATVERPVTDWLVSVQRVLKGTVESGSVVVRVPGGSTPDGLVLRIDGAPRFGAGERVLLFLEPRPDGTYGLHQFLLGAFHTVRAGGRTAAVRDLSEVQVLTRKKKLRTGARLRDFEQFQAWIEDRVAGDRRRPDYRFRASSGQLGAIIAAFTLFENAGRHYRWFEFDDGRPVVWRAHQDGEPGLPDGGFDDFRRALGAWNAERSTPIQLQYAGTSTSTNGFQTFDRQNVLLFDDPNQDIEGTFDCSEGGTVAIGGPWADPNVTGRFDGKTFIRIQAADIVINDGIECLLQRSRCPDAEMEEIYAHETGHTLGIGHSSENENETNATLREALMYFQAHGDCRGARLNSDDVAGLRALYARSGGGGGGGGGSCPAGSLCFLGGRFEVSATWENQFNPGETGVAQPVPYSDLAGFFHFSDDPRNIELVVKVVDYGGRILVFFSELTKIHFELRVTDRQGGTSKTYRNTASDCGGIDTDFIGTPGALNLTTGGPPAVIRDLGITDQPGRACVAGPGTLCLLRNRFKVTLPTWTSQFDGSTGAGAAKVLNDIAGAFHFTADPRNLEVFFKMNQFPDRFLVFFGSLSVMDYTLLLTDTVTGRTVEFRNPSGRYCGGFVNDLHAGPPF